MPKSTIEIVHDDLIEQFKQIAAPAYRNTVAEVEKIVREVDDVTNFPSIAVVPLGEKITSADTEQLQFKSVVEFLVIGYVQSQIDAARGGLLTDAMESLVHDCKRVLADLVNLGFLNSKGYYVSFADAHGGVRVTRFFDISQTKGFFTIDFPAVVHSTDKRFYV